MGRTNDTGAAIDVQAVISLTAMVGDLVTQLRADAEERKLRDHQRAAQIIRQVPLSAPQLSTASGNLIGGAGVIDIPDSLAAKTGYFWSVRRLTLTGWSAGSVLVAVNGSAALGGELVAPFPVPAVYTYGKGDLLLHPGDRLVISATGITGFVNLYGAVDVFEQWYLPHYLGGMGGAIRHG